MRLLRFPMAARCYAERPPPCVKVASVAGISYWRHRGYRQHRPLRYREPDHRRGFTLSICDRCGWLGRARVTGDATLAFEFGSVSALPGLDSASLPTISLTIIMTAKRTDTRVTVFFFQPGTNGGLVAQNQFQMGCCAFAGYAVRCGTREQHV